MKTLENMIAANKASIPGNNELDAVALLGRLAARQGGDADLVAADGPHDGELLAERQGDQLHPGIVDRRQGRLRRRARRASGACRRATPRRCRPIRSNPEAAYLFMQWVTSPPVSLVRTMLPYSLRDPYRLSHYKSELYRRAVAGREGLPRQPQQFGQRRPGRHDHAGLAGLRALARPDVHRGLGRRRPEGGAAKGGRGMGRRPRSGSASMRRRPPTRNTRSCPAPPPITRSRRWARRCKLD